MVWDKERLAGHVVIGDIVENARKAVAAARAAGADAVVVVAHAGLGGETVTYSIPGMPAENHMAQVALDVPGIDVIVYGHTHREVADTEINGVLLTQPRYWAASVSLTHLEFDVGGSAKRLVAKHATVVRAGGHAEDPAIASVVDAGHQAARRYAATVIGRTDVAWRSDSARVADVPVMDFVSETMRRVSGARLASAAAFSVDLQIPAGPVTAAQLAQLYPYDNTLTTVEISGAQLRAYLEQSARYFKVTGTGAAMHAAPDPLIPGYNFETVTGADYVIDLTRPAGSRITTLTVGGKAVSPGDSFSIALSNYRAAGGGGYSMLNGARVVRDRQEDIRELLIAEVARRHALKPSDYFTRNWRLEPASLGAEVYSALWHGPRFDAVAGASARSAKASVVRVIATTDFHGAFGAHPEGASGMRGGAGQMAAVIERAEAECVAPGCAWVLLDAGDLFQGTPASNLAFGRPVIDLYNARGYTAAAIGNHEFDWGRDTLRARIRDAHFAMLAANVRYDDGRPVEWIRADTLVERGGVKIGVIGIAARGTPATTKAENVRGLRFDAAAPVIDAHARSLRARGAELIVVIEHDGAFCDPGTPCRGEIIDVARQLTEPVDAIVAGHTHVGINTVVNGIPVVEAKSSSRAVGVIDLPLDRAARPSALHEVREVVTDSITPDPRIDALVRAATRAVSRLVEQPVATAAASMDRHEERHDPQYALGNLIADAQRAAGHSDVGIMNNGGIRADMQAGPVTYGSLFEIQPFGNLLVRVTVHGKDLRAYFERLVSRAVRSHVSGAIVRFDSTRPPGSRIVSATVGGAPLDDQRDYTLTYTDFLATGGDGLGLAKVAVKSEVLGVPDLEALVDYVKALPGAVIRPDVAPRLIPVTP